MAQVCLLLHQRYSEFGTELNASLKQLLTSDARSGGALCNKWSADYAPRPYFLPP